MKRHFTMASISIKECVSFKGIEAAVGLLGCQPRRNSSEVDIVDQVEDAAVHRPCTIQAVSIRSQSSLRWIELRHRGHGE